MITIDKRLIKTLCSMSWSLNCPLRLSSLFFIYEQFYKNKSLGFGEKLRTTWEQSQVRCPTEHKNKVSWTRHKNKLICLFYFSPVIFDWLYWKWALKQVFLSVWLSVALLLQFLVLQIISVLWKFLKNVEKKEEQIKNNIP